MLPRAAVMSLVFICFSISHGAELYRWTDEMGRVHFSDSIPRANKNKAKIVDLKSADVPPQQIQEAQARLAKEKSRLNQPSPAIAVIPQGKTQPLDKESSCEDQWAKYDESWACFNPYRTANGSVRREAYEHCSEMKSPSCVLPVK